MSIGSIVGSSDSSYFRLASFHQVTRVWLCGGTSSNLKLPIQCSARHPHPLRVRAVEAEEYESTNGEITESTHCSHSGSIWQNDVYNTWYSLRAPAPPLSGVIAVRQRVLTTYVNRFSVWRRLLYHNYNSRVVLNILSFDKARTTHDTNSTSKVFLLVCVREFVGVGWEWCIGLYIE